MTEGASEICPSGMLRDTPSEEDLFGSHQRVGDALAGLIRSEDGGQAVALTGAWGSGKSTVVRLLRKSLELGTDEAASSTKVFTFDAWAHQGDSLRRSFLEELVGFLNQASWIQMGAWQKKLDEVTRRRETTTTKSTSLLTPLGKFFALLAVLAPFGYLLFSHYGGADRAGKLGLVLALAPIGLALVAYLWWRPWKMIASRRIFKKKELRTFFTKHRPPHEDESIATLFVQKARTFDKTTTLRPAEPTSVEFRRFFFELLADALVDEKRRLVLVLDNLDRVDSDEIANIWSTMRTFFEESSQPFPEIQRRFWLIVPYDPDGLARFWKGEEKPSLSGVFLEKSFQMAFRVPTPVLANWKAYLRDLLSQALPAHDSEEFEEIVRLYQAFVHDTELVVTPRRLKLFANRIAALHRERQHELSFSALALYSLYEQTEDKLIDRIVSGSLLSPQVANRVDLPTWQVQLAALHFGSSQTDAQHILLNDRIEGALRAGNQEEIASLSEFPGFSEVCDYILHDVVAESPAPAVLAACARAIAGLESTNGQLDHMWDLLRTALETVQDWQGLDSATGEGLTMVIRRTSDANQEALVRNLLTTLSSSPPAAREGE